MLIGHPIPEIRLFQKFDLENSRSRSWVRWTLKVTTWVQHSINLHPFHSMSNGHSIPEMRLFFKIWPWKFKVNVMVEVKVESHKVGVASCRLTSLSFHVNRPSHSWDTAFSKFDLENPRSRWWVRWTLKVTTWVQHPIDSHPFCSMSIGHPIPEIRLFQNLTLKIQGQGHGWGERWKSQHGPNILSTHTPLIVHPIPGRRLFQIWPWKSKVKVMIEVKVESHKVGVTFCRLTSLSFHVNRPSHSWDTLFSKFDLGNPRSRSNDHNHDDVAQLQVQTIP